MLFSYRCCTCAPISCIDRYACTLLMGAVSMANAVDTAKAAVSNITSSTAKRFFLCLNERFSCCSSSLATAYLPPSSLYQPLPISGEITIGLVHVESSAVRRKDKAEARAYEDVSQPPSYCSLVRESTSASVAKYTLI